MLGLGRWEENAETSFPGWYSWQANTLDTDAGVSPAGTELCLLPSAPAQQLQCECLRARAAPAPRSAHRVPGVVSYTSPLPASAEVERESFFFFFK